MALTYNIPINLRAIIDRYFLVVSFWKYCLFSSIKLSGINIPPVQVSVSWQYLDPELCQSEYWVLSPLMTPTPLEDLSSFSSFESCPSVVAPFQEAKPVHWKKEIFHLRGTPEAGIINNKQPTVGFGGCQSKKSSWNFYSGKISRQHNQKIDVFASEEEAKLIYTSKIKYVPFCKHRGVIVYKWSCLGPYKRSQQCYQQHTTLAQRWAQYVGCVWTQCCMLLRVASCELRVASCELRVVSC